MKTVGVLLILIWVTSEVVAGQQGPEGDAVTVIRALEREWVEGQSRNDIRALDLIFDNALVYVEYGKLVTKGEYLSRIKRAGPEVSGIEMGPMTIRRFENTAIVVGTYSERERSNGQFRVKRWRFIDTWVYKQNGWVLVGAAGAPLSR